jgi:hypothetical protein
MAKKIIQTTPAEAGVVLPKATIRNVINALETACGRGDRYKADEYHLLHIMFGLKTELNALEILGMNKVPPDDRTWIVDMLRETLIPEKYRNSLDSDIFEDLFRCNDVAYCTKIFTRFQNGDKINLPSQGDIWDMDGEKVLVIHDDIGNDGEDQVLLFGDFMLSDYRIVDLAFTGHRIGHISDHSVPDGDITEQSLASYSFGQLKYYIGEACDRGIPYRKNNYALVRQLMNGRKTITVLDVLKLRIPVADMHWIIHQLEMADISGYSIDCKADLVQAVEESIEKDTPDAANGQIWEFADNIYLMIDSDSDTVINLETGEMDTCFDISDAEYGSTLTAKQLAEWKDRFQA